MIPKAELRAVMREVVTRLGSQPQPMAPVTASELPLQFQLLRSFSLSEPPEARYPAIAGVYGLLLDMQHSRSLQALGNALLRDECLARILGPEWSKPFGRTLVALDYALSALWRYVLEAPNPMTWDEALFTEIVSTSERTRAKPGITLRLSVPLFGLSGEHAVNSFALGSWMLEPLTEGDSKRLRASRYMFELPVPMAYIGATPAIGYALVYHNWTVAWDALTGGWTAVSPESLPLAEIESNIAILSAATGIHLPQARYSIRGMVVLVHTTEWTLNPFGNPFPIDYAWPLERYWGDREWFAAPQGWSTWVQSIHAHVNSATAEDRERYHRSLRWYTASTRAPSQEERLIQLFLAIDILFGPGGEQSRDRARYIADNVAGAVGQDKHDARKWRRFIEKAYTCLRNPLIHGALSSRDLQETIRTKLGLDDQEHCADMLETAFLAALNRRISRPRDSDQNL